MNTKQRQHWQYQLDQARRLGHMERAERLAERLGMTLRRTAA